MDSLIRGFQIHDCMGQIQSVLSHHLYKDSKIQLLLKDANEETNMTDFVFMMLFLSKLPNSKSCIIPLNHLRASTLVSGFTIQCCPLFSLECPLIRDVSLTG